MSSQVLYFRHMSSVLGRNVLVGCEHFGLSVEGLLADSFLLSLLTVFPLLEGMYNHTLVQLLCLN